MHNHSSDSSTDNDKKTKVWVLSFSIFIRESRKGDRYLIFEGIKPYRIEKYRIEKYRSISLVGIYLIWIYGASLPMSRLISACETNSSQAATEYASEHSNHGKHCHYKI